MLSYIAFQIFWMALHCFIVENNGINEGIIEFCLEIKEIDFLKPKGYWQHQWNFDLNYQLPRPASVFIFKK